MKTVRDMWKRKSNSKTQTRAHTSKKPIVLFNSCEYRVAFTYYHYKFYFLPISILHKIRIKMLEYWRREKEIGKKKKKTVHELPFCWGFARSLIHLVATFFSLRFAIIEMIFHRKCGSITRRKKNPLEIY